MGVFIMEFIPPTEPFGDVKRYSADTAPDADAYYYFTHGYYPTYNYINLFLFLYSYGK